LGLDRTILITGSTDGIGRETAIRLARMGAQVLLHGRNRDRGKVALQEIRRGTGSDRLGFFLADLASLRQVRTLAAETRRFTDRLEVLINNAGTFQPRRALTDDGMETTFAVNYLAPFLLTHELLDLMKRSAPCRIVNVASAAHWDARWDPGNLQGEMHYEGFDAYSLSKLALVLFTYTLARRLRGTGITVNCLHPGVIRTKLLAAGFGDYPGDTPQRGARTSVYLASSQDVEEVTGQYFENCRIASSSPISHNRVAQEELWEISKKLAGVPDW